MIHPTECSGCPHCDEVCAAVIRDTDPKSLAQKLTALTARTLRVLGVSPRHPLVARASGVPSPSQDALADRLGRAKPSSVREQMGKTAPIGPAPVYPTTTPTNAPPSMADAIKKRT